MSTCQTESSWQPCAAVQVGRGESLGAVWAITGGCHDTSALAIRDSELVRMSKVSCHLLVAVACQRGCLQGLLLAADARMVLRWCQQTD